MKKLTVKGKLSLNKETIAKLTSDELYNANGGATATCLTGFTCACPSRNCPTAGTKTNCQFCCIPPCW